VGEDSGKEEDAAERGSDHRRVEENRNSMGIAYMDAQNGQEKVS